MSQQGITGHSEDIGQKIEALFEAAKEEDFEDGMAM